MTSLPPKKGEHRLFKCKLMQDGFCVASVESVDKEQAEREIQHYAMVYSQDGPVEIKRNYK